MSRLLTPELEALIGTTAIYANTEPIGRSAIRYFSLAIGDDNPLYRDRVFARELGYSDVIAPPTFICETNYYMDRFRDEDGYIGHTWNISIPGTRLIRGGHEYEFVRPAYPTDCISAHWKIVDISERISPKGPAMLLVLSEVRFINQDDELLATNNEPLIYQELPADA